MSRVSAITRIGDLIGFLLKSTFVATAIRSWDDFDEEASVSTRCELRSPAIYLPARLLFYNTGSKRFFDLCCVPGGLLLSSSMSNWYALMGVSCRRGPNIICSRLVKGSEPGWPLFPKSNWLSS